MKLYTVFVKIVNSEIKVVGYSPTPRARRVAEGLDALASLDVKPFRHEHGKRSACRSLASSVARPAADQPHAADQEQVSVLPLDTASG